MVVNNRICLKLTSHWHVATLMALLLGLARGHDCWAQYSLDYALSGIEISDVTDVNGVYQFNIGWGEPVSDSTTASGYKISSEVESFLILISEESGLSLIHI